MGERRVSRVSIAAGVALGLVVALAALRFAPRHDAKPPEVGDRIAGTLLPEDRGAIREVALHYVASLEPLVADTYRDFLLGLGPNVAIDAIVQRGDREAWEHFVREVAPAIADHAKVVEVDGPLTVWSKDRALVVGPDATAPRTTLVVPLKPDPKWEQRLHDWGTIPALAAAMPDRFVVRELPLEFDAGDFAVTKDRVIIDANLWGKNRGKSPRTATAESTRALVQSLFGKETVLLGAEPGDVPRHHLAMYMASLPSRGGHTMLVGDPAAARALLPPGWTPGVDSTDTGDPLVPDFGPETVARFERAAADLAKAGFDVVRVPVVPFDDKTYITYTNGVFEVRGGIWVAYVPIYGISALDDVARRVYERLGWKIVPVRVSTAWPYHGTVGCLVNVLVRS
jgi:hypothetical protein